MKIALLTTGLYDKYSLALFGKLKNQDTPIGLIIVEALYSQRKIKKNIKEVGFVSSFKRFMSKEKTKNPYLKKYIKDLDLERSTLKELVDETKIVNVSNINSMGSIKALKEYKPDVIIYAGGGIVKKEIIKNAKKGVINAHMGLLPEYRGMNVLEWSLFKEDGLGVSVHYIDEGIDTGPMLLQKKIDIIKGDNIESLRNKTTPLSVELVSEVIKGIEKNKLKPKKQGSGKQYFIMHPRLKKIVEKRLKKKK